MKKVLVSISLLACSAVTLLAADKLPMTDSSSRFEAHDPIGWIMAILSMGVVFVALLVLFLCFKYGYTGITALALRLKKLFHRQKQLETITEKRSKRDKEMKVTDANGAEVNDDELAAAIGVALFLHADGMHDAESDVLTLAPAASAWTGAGQNQKKSPIRKF